MPASFHVFPPAKGQAANMGEPNIPGLVYPRVGILSTAIATLLAMFLVPDAFQEPGALRTPAIIAIVGLIFAPTLAAFRDLRSLVRAENVLAIAPTYWLLLDVLQGRYVIDIAGKQEVVMSFGAIGTFSCGVWAGTLCRPRRLPAAILRVSQFEFSAATGTAASIACFLLGVFYFVWKANFDISTILTSLMQSRYEAAWSRTDALGDWSAITEHLQYFGMILPAIAVILGLKTSLLDPRTIFAWLLALIFSSFEFQGGNRRYLGVMFGSAIVVWLISSKKPRILHAFCLGLFAASMLYLMEVILAYRDAGVMTFVDAEKRESLTQFGTIRVDDNFLRLAQTIYYVPEKQPYTGFEQIYHAIIRPIPRALWSGKPTELSFRLYEIINIGASLSSSIVGELYLSGGFVVVLIGGALFGWLGAAGSTFLSYARTSAGSLLYGSSLMALFAGCRSMLDLVLMYYIVLAELVIIGILMAVLPPLSNPRHSALNASAV